MKKILKIILIILAVAAVAALCVRLVPLVLSLREPESRAEFQNFIDSLGVWGVLLMFALQVLQIVVAVIPGEPIELLMGLMYGTIGGLALTIAGTVAGSAIVFMAVRRLGEKFAKKFIDTGKFKKLGFLKDPVKRDPLIFLLFFIPGTPKDVLTYFAPFTGIGFVRFLFLSTLARIPSIVSSTLVGATVSEGEFVKSLLIFAATGVIGAAGILINNHIMGRRRKSD